MKTDGTSFGTRTKRTYTNMAFFVDVQRDYKIRRLWIPRYERDFDYQKDVLDLLEKPSQQYEIKRLGNNSPLFYQRNACKKDL